jgi:hypothetical protein
MACVFLISHNAMAKVSSNNIEYIPKNGLNVDWPILDDRQYFTYRGRSSRDITLRYLIHHDCHKLAVLYGQDPISALYDLELVLLVQFVLRGIDIQLMSQTDRENLALSEVAKRLRQLGRNNDTRNLFKTPKVAPSLAGLCEILEEDKEDLLRQKYHLRHQWDRYKKGFRASDSDN